MRTTILFVVTAALCGTAFAPAPAVAEENKASKHTFAIGTNAFLLDGKPFQIRCGELHFTRVPREYWRHRLQLCKAMGLNTVCAYLFWNAHEFEPGKYDWSGQLDAAEFCRTAQEEGLWVILRPGPYACAEWDGGGLPWWLLKIPDIRLRSQDPRFLAPAAAWLKEVGRVLGPLQVTHGGPILMAQVENEYGYYGRDSAYMGKIRQAVMDAGFDVPLFDCNPAGELRTGFCADLFHVVNFGTDPQNGYRSLREVQPVGPLMCGEFYPGWFDTWGVPHHLGNTDQFLRDLDYMLKAGGSFSIYMAHGGTTFGLWSGTDRPFKPDTSTYSYDAPIGEAGRIGEKFQRTRDLISKYLLPGETLPEPPSPKPAMALPPFILNQTAAVLENLPAPIRLATPTNMEAFDQGHGCAVYRFEVPAGPAATLRAEDVRDFAWVYLDGRQAGVMDRRMRPFSVKLPAREKPARLDILVEAMGHVNFGNEMHDRKGLGGPVRLITNDGTNTLSGAWQVYPLRLDAPMLSALAWKTGTAGGPAFWRGTFNVDKPMDTFLDLRNWGKGVVWVNGICLSRYWNIGPSQTVYVPGPWLRTGTNEVIVLDLLGPSKPVIAGLENPILNQLRLELDFSRKDALKVRLELNGTKPVYTNSFAPGTRVQEVRLPQPVTGRQFCLEALSSQDGKPFAAIAELDLLDRAGNSISHANWKIAYVDSEELGAEDGSASNAINGQTSDFWHTEWSARQPGYPHQIVIDLGEDASIGGFRYTPRAGDDSPGHIKNYQIFVGSGLVREMGR